MAGTGCRADRCDCNARCSVPRQSEQVGRLVRRQERVRGHACHELTCILTPQLAQASERSSPSAAMQRLLAWFSNSLQSPAAGGVRAGWGTPLQAVLAQAAIPQHAVCAWHVLLPGGVHPCAVALHLTLDPLGACMQASASSPCAASTATPSSARAMCQVSCQYAPETSPQILSVCLRKCRDSLSVLASASFSLPPASLCWSAFLCGGLLAACCLWKRLRL